MVGYFKNVSKSKAFQGMTYNNNNYNNNFF